MNMKNWADLSPEVKKRLRPKLEVFKKRSLFYDIQMTLEGRGDLVDHVDQVIADMEAESPRKAGIKPSRRRKGSKRRR